jgi:PAS domain S-box-containing protein
LGYAREEFIGRPFIDFVFDEDRSMQAQEFQQRRRGISGQYERRVRCKNGSVKWLFFSAKAVMSAQGALVGTFAMITDITERKRMEAALKQASEDWQATFDAINDIVIMLNPGHEIMAINQTGLKAIGKTREEVIGQKCYRIVHGSEKPIKLCPCEKCLISSKIETSEYAQGGRTYELVACPIVDANNRIRAFTHIVKDITDRKRADEYVQNLAKFPSENPSPVMRMNRDGVILYANEASAPILSYWKCGPEMMVPESMKKILQEVFESRDKYTSEIQIDRKTYLFTMAPFPEDCYTNIYAVDITERKLAGEKLRESEEKYRNLVDGADEAILVVQDGMLKFINHKTAELSGYSGPDLMGKPFSEYIYPDDRTMVVDNYVKRMKGEPAPSRYEFRLLAVDGSAKWVEMNTVQIDWNSKPASLIFLTDISERKQHENEKEKLLAQLLQAQKMEAIGTLAGGVAHDFNNLLTAISGYTTMAMGKIDESDPVQRDLKQVSIAATKAAGVTRQLLLFSRKQHMEPVPMDPNATISHLLKMLDRLIGEDIVIETGLEKDVWSILGDEGNIEQVLMNLSVNARDAMPSGGKLFIKTENVILDQEYCRTCKTARPGRFVCVSVSDTGTGMDEMTQEHIFEPFFTTKEAGKGTGLGLSVVFGIVQQHKGWINIYSEFGHGTTIKVYFPASSARPEQKSKEEVPLASLQGKGERIMVVEDQAEVRELAVEILKTTGYSVFPVSSAKEAMEVFEKENGRFDLVFSDVVLTDMTGILLVENLLKRWKFGVIITSGYTDEKAHWDFIKENNYRFLHKPYTRHDLLHAVKDVLDEKKS